MHVAFDLNERLRPVSANQMGHHELALKLNADLQRLFSQAFYVPWLFRMLIAIIH